MNNQKTDQSDTELQQAIKESSYQSGVLSQLEFDKAFNEAVLPFKKNAPRNYTALQCCLVYGYTNSHAMEVTGIHRTKIATAKAIVLQKWRENEAKNRTGKITGTA